MELGGFSIRKYIEEKGFIGRFREESVDLAGIETKVAGLAPEEVEAIAETLDMLFNINTAYIIRKTVAEGFDLLKDVVRCVKSYNKQGFGGIRAKERELTMLSLTPDIFDSVWGSTDVTSWDKDISGAGVYDFVGSPDNPETTAEEEAIVIFGFADPILIKEYPNSQPESPIKRVELGRDIRQRFYLDTTFEYCENYPFVALPEPFIVLPESEFWIKVQCSTGSTKFRPVGVKICPRTSVSAIFG